MRIDGQQLEWPADDSIRGAVADGWASVERAARANLTTGDEVGFQLSVQVNGESVVDLHGGAMNIDSDAPYPDSALQMTFSVSKGVLALCVGLLIERGDLDIANPVADYWPEFARHGKQNIRVRDLLTHSAGLPAFARPMSVTELTDWELCVEQLADQRPVWEGSGLHGYHAITSGFLVGEVIRRITGLRPREFLQSELADPLRLDLWFGVPPDRLNDVIPHIAGSDVTDPVDSVVRRRNAAADYVRSALTNPPINLATLDQPVVWQSEIPAISVVGDARSLATCYSIAVPGRNERLSPRTLQLLLGSEVWGEDEILLDQPTRFAGLFMRPSPREPLLGNWSFGHNGYTGSLAFADPPSGVTFAYLGVRADGRSTPHARITRLLTAILGCI